MVSLFRTLGDILGLWKMDSIKGETTLLFGEKVTKISFQVGTSDASFTLKGNLPFFLNYFPTLKRKED